MANTTDDKLDLLKATKEDFKAAFSECGHVVGEVFATYPNVVREIGKGGETATLTIDYRGIPNVLCLFVNAEGSLIESDSGSPIGQFPIQVPSIVFVRSVMTSKSGSISLITSYTDLNSNRNDEVFLVTGNASIRY